MLEVIGLVVPFFGLILIGYVLGRRSELSQDQMGWMNFFIIYVALPALFFKLMAKTPVEQLANWHFVLGTTGVTFFLFVAVLFGRAVFAAGWVAGCDDPGVCSCLRQHWLYGAGHGADGVRA